MQVEQVLPRLAEAYRVLKSDEVGLEPGDMVIWREGLKNKRYPDYGEAAVVLDVLDSPVVDLENDIASQYYGEELNTRIGFFDEDDDFVSFLFDGRRFEVLKTGLGENVTANSVEV